MAAKSENQRNMNDWERGLLRQFISLLVLPLLTVVLVLATLVFTHSDSLRRSVGTQELLLLDNASQRLAAELRMLFYDLRLISGSSAAETFRIRQDSDSKLQLSNHLKQVLDQNPNYGELRVITKAGEPIVHVNRPGLEQATIRQIETAVQHRLPEQEEGWSDGGPFLLAGGPISTGDSDSSQPIILAGLALSEADPDRSRLYLVGTQLVGPVEAHFSGVTASDWLIAVTRASAAPELPAEFAGLTPVLEQTAEQSNHGQIYTGDGLFSFVRFAVRLDSDGGGPGSRQHILTPIILASRIPSAYFITQRTNYTLHVALIGLTVLLPILVVCWFLARKRVHQQRLVQERQREQGLYLDKLEAQAVQRTRELDDRSLQLSAEIAERLNAETHLRQTNALLSVMLESIEGIIYVADFETHEILFANTYLKNLFGFDPVGKKCWQYIHSSQDGPCTFCSHDKLLDEHGEPTGPYSWEYQNPFNKKWYAAKDQAIRWSNGKFVALEIAVDITEQKRLQHFLQEARRQADLAKGIRNRFVALVAHDLKSPFYSIIQMLKRILKRETFTHRVHQQFLENIVENGHQMLQMIDKLLSMDRFESGDIKLERVFFDVSKMGDEVMQNFSHYAFEKGVRMANAIPAETSVYADKYLYFVVLNNLVSNAIKFSDRGGTIELLVPDLHRPMTIAVKDTGKGMSKDYLDNLFKADVKTTSKGTRGESGSGLGLIFCQDILRAHSGGIIVESERGVGTVFSVKLPECSPYRRHLDNQAKQTANHLGGAGESAATNQLSV